MTIKYRQIEKETKKQEKENGKSKKRKERTLVIKAIFKRRERNS